jgi:hypothetical protein
MFNGAHYLAQNANQVMPLKTRKKLYQVLFTQEIQDPKESWCIYN